MLQLFISCKIRFFDSEIPWVHDNQLLNIQIEVKKLGFSLKRSLVLGCVCSLKT